MAADALPAPRTMGRPRGAGGGGTHLAACAEAMAASNMLRSKSLEPHRMSEKHRLEQCRHLRGVSRDLDAALFHDSELFHRGALSAGNDRARVAHAFSRWRGDAGDETHDRLRHVMLDPMRAGFLVIAADFPHHDQ